MADQYLWTYEIEFLSQLVDAAAIRRTANTPNNAASKQKQANKLLKGFTWTCRYIDDLLALNNPHFKKLLYTTDWLWGLKGIYPNCLDLSQSDSGTSVKFLDIDIF